MPSRPRRFSRWRVTDCRRPGKAYLRGPFAHLSDTALQKTLSQTLKVLAFFGIGFTILYFVFQRQQAAYLEECALKGIPVADCSLVDKVIYDFGTVNWWWIGAVLLAFTLSNWSRTVRWVMLLRPMGYRPRLWNGYGTIMMGYFANLFFPRIGEIVRAGAMSRYERIPVERVVGTVVVDRIADVLSLALVLALSFFLEFDKITGFFFGGNEQVGDTAATPLYTRWWFIFGVSVGLGCVLLWILRQRILELAIYRRLRQIAVGFLEGLRTVRQLDNPTAFILHSINVWAMYFLMAWLALFAFPPTAGLTWVAGLLVFTFGALGILIPSPGGMGTYHFLVISVLTLFYGVADGDAFSYANILFFSVQGGGNIIQGLLAFALLPLYNRGYVPAEPGAAAPPVSRVEV